MWLFKDRHKASGMVPRCGGMVEMRRIEQEDGGDDEQKIVQTSERTDGFLKIGMA